MYSPEIECPIQEFAEELLLEVGICTKCYLDSLLQMNGMKLSRSDFNNRKIDFAVNLNIAYVC